MAQEKAARFAPGEFERLGLEVPSGRLGQIHIHYGNYSKREVIE
jgi:hypothetical protein